MKHVSSPTHIVRLGATTLSHGGQLPNVDVAYEQYGTLSESGDNAILVCHALTGSARAAGPDGWWDPLIGPGRAFDTNRYAVICANILGSCYGTTGPASHNPARGEPYGMEFPEITVADMVAVQRRLLETIGVRSLVTVAGGSLGGLQVLEWAAQAPEMVRSIIPVASGVAHSAWNIAFNQAARQAIRQDPDWHGGKYASHGVTPEAGLALARMIAMISYRSAESFESRFGRETARANGRGEHPYGVVSYLQYQGKRLVQRFDANCYLRITEAMDGYDVGEGRGGAAAALRDFRGPALVLSIDSDVLYPRWQQEQICSVLEENGNRVMFAEMQSPDGHDAFLMEWDQMSTHIGGLMGSLE